MKSDIPINMEIAPIINEYTMAISSGNMKRELCMIGISTKIYPEKTITGETVVGTTHCLFNAGLMFHPNVNYSNYKPDISFDELIRNYRKDNFLVQKQDECRIVSTCGRKLLVTLKKESQYYEFICDSVNKGQLLFKDKRDYADFNQETCNELDLNYSDYKSDGYAYSILLSDLIEIYSIEVYGYTLKKMAPSNDSWFPDGECSCFGGYIEYDDKVITAAICRSEETGHSRRTSNGWLRTYVEYRADLYHRFNTRREIDAFWNELREKYKDVEIRIENYDDFASWNISFPNAVKEEYIINIMHFSVSGSSWKEEI